MSILSNPLSHAFGLDIGDRSFKLIQLRGKGASGLPKLVAWNKISVPEGVMEHGAVKDMDKATSLIHDLIQGARGRLRGHAVAACLPEGKSFVKMIKVPGANPTKEALRNAVTEEITQNIPLPIDEIYFDWQIVNNEKDELPILDVAQKAETSESRAKKRGTATRDEGQDKEGEEKETSDETDEDPASDDSGGNENGETVVLLGAAPKDIVDDYTIMLQKAGLVPIVLEIETAAITRAIVPDDKMREASLAILDIGATRSSLVIYDDAALQMSITIPFSGNEVARLIHESLQISWEEAEEMKLRCGLGTAECGDTLWNILLPLIDDMAERIRDALRFYRINFDDNETVDRLYLCGGGALFKDIDTVLARKLTMKVRLADPLNNLDNALPKKFPAEKALAFTTAIGLGLRAVYEDTRHDNPKT